MHYLIIFKPRLSSLDPSPRGLMASHCTFENMAALTTCSLFWERLAWGEGGVPWSHQLLPTKCFVVAPVCPLTCLGAVVDLETRPAPTESTTGTAVTAKPERTARVHQSHVPEERENHRKMTPKAMHTYRSLLPTFFYSVLSYYRGLILMSAFSAEVYFYRLQQINKS